MAKLNLANWIDCTEVEGPGKRLALWVQGCLQRCPECCNPHMLDIAPRAVVETQEVLNWIRNAKNEHAIEGVTFLGGEPMLQARGLSEVARGCHENELSVMIFTGYSLENLKKNPLPGFFNLLKYTDILVDGPFISVKPERTRNWVGSMNQQFHFLTDRYTTGIEFDPTYSQGFELRIFKDGTLRANGCPSGIELNR